jgi:hypothetical protein
LEQNIDESPRMAAEVRADLALNLRAKSFEGGFQLQSASRGELRSFGLGHRWDWRSKKGDCFALCPVVNFMGAARPTPGSRKPPVG